VTTLYNGTTWSGNGIMAWESADPEFESFVPTDTIGNVAEYVVGDTTYLDVKVWSSSLDWTPDGNLLVGALRQSWGGPMGSQWWIFDPVNDEYLESFGTPVDDEYGNLPWGYHLAGGVNGPRGGFFTDANTVYTVDFYLNTLDKWTWTESSVDNDVVVLDKFTLKQNYPNPFNPTTTIPFSIENDGLVKLIVYDILGHEVATLVDKKMNPGSYKFDFDASGYATGMYVYRLTVDGKQMAKKCYISNSTFGRFVLKKGLPDGGPFFIGDPCFHLPSTLPSPLRYAEQVASLRWTSHCVTCLHPDESGLRQSGAGQDAGQEY
ncbi:MAG: T9SS type A sorting domain-containing protein, partial [Candidatus Marinimicrobia bacterium]|nr:T9SS type A sorting domain-containing protein [Candidatus Neomarinimicrobiota bacterium]